MQPHTAGLIGVLNDMYLRSGSVHTTPLDTPKQYDVRIVYSKEKHYEIRVRSVGEDRLRFQIEKVSDPYPLTCETTVDRNRYSFRVSHRHRIHTNVTEHFELFPGEEVRNGHHRNTEMNNGPFESQSSLAKSPTTGSSSEVMALYDRRKNERYKVYIQRAS